MYPPPLPPEFVAYWHALIERSCNVVSARRRLLHEWHTGSSIPGFGTAGQWFACQFPEREFFEPNVLPRGWSLGNLTRLARCKPAKNGAMAVTSQEATEAQRQLAQLYRSALSEVRARPLQPRRALSSTNRATRRNRNA